MENGYPVKWILHQVQNGMPIEEAEEIINMYISISCRKGYTEGILDSIKRLKKASLSRANEKVDILGPCESEGA